MYKFITLHMTNRTCITKEANRAMDSDAEQYEGHSKKQQKLAKM